MSPVICKRSPIVFIRGFGTAVPKHNPSSCARAAEELLEVLKESKEGYSKKAVKMAEDLVHSIKSLPQPTVVAEGCEIVELQKELYKLKASFNASTAVIYVIFGMFGACLIVYPSTVHKVQMKADNDHDKLLKEHGKLQIQVDAPEARIRAGKDGAEAANGEARKGEAAKGEAGKDEASKGALRTWICSLFRCREA